jgi:2,3-dimethylmalate lyase
MKKSRRLRELFERPEIFVLAGGANALQARFIEMAGFEAAYMTGSGTSAYLLGLPDAGLTTATEMVLNAGYMARAIEIPLVADADTGYGNAINVRRTVQSYIAAGVSGMHIEDQVFPKRCGFVSGKELIPLEEAVGKYRAAVDARDENDPDFVLIARTDARTAVGGSLDEAIRRARAYKQAGVDVVYVEAPQSAEEIRAIRAAIDGPLMCTTIAIDPPLSWDEMEDLGLAVAFYPGLAGTAANVAAWDYLHDFRTRGVAAERDFKERIQGHPLANFGLFTVLGFPEIRRMEEKYLPAESQEKYAESVGAYTP